MPKWQLRNQSKLSDFKEIEEEAERLMEIENPVKTYDGEIPVLIGEGG